MYGEDAGGVAVIRRRNRWNDDNYRHFWVEFEDVEQASKRAVLVRFGADRSVWLPKSRITAAALSGADDWMRCVLNRGCGAGRLYLPRWLLEKNGLTPFMRVEQAV